MLLLIPEDGGFVHPKTPGLQDYPELQLGGKSSRIYNVFSIIRRIARRVYARNYTRKIS
jgi:hypothetical protein